MGWVELSMSLLSMTELYIIPPYVLWAWDYYFVGAFVCICGQVWMLVLHAMVTRLSIDRLGDLFSFWKVYFLALVLRVLCETFGPA